MAAIRVIMTDSKTLFFFTVLVRFVLVLERIGEQDSAVEGDKGGGRQSYPHCG